MAALTTILAVTAGIAALAKDQGDKAKKAAGDAANEQQAEVDRLKAEQQKQADQDAAEKKSLKASAAVRAGSSSGAGGDIFSQGLLSDTAGKRKTLLGE